MSRTTNTRSSWSARHLGLPALLLGTGLSLALAIRLRMRLEPASLLILFAAIGYLFVLERMIPFRESWRPSRRELRRDGLYFGLNGAVGSLVTALVGVTSIHFARDASGLALLPEIVLGYLLATFLGYWIHRLEHVSGALWLVHGIHHRPSKLNVANNSVFHFLDLILQSAPPLAALVWLGFSAEAVFVVHTFGQVSGFANHANADLRMGPLNYLVGSPQQHRLHHSVELEEAGHFTALPLWDLAFGTFRWRAGREPREVGVLEPDRFPPSESIASSTLHPLRSWIARSSA